MATGSQPDSRSTPAAPTASPSGGPIAADQPDAPRHRHRPAVKDTPGVHPYMIRSGDTLTDIARRFGTNALSIAASNPGLDPDRLQPGQRIRVPNFKGVVHTVQAGETLLHLAERYGVTPAGLRAANPALRTGEPRSGEPLLIPGGRAPLVLASRGGARRQTPVWAWPVTGPITSGFGPRWGTVHLGIDIAAAADSPIRAARAGRVARVDWNDDWGLYVLIAHDSGWESLYAHAARVYVEPGNWVNQGDRIAAVGSTGLSTGPHLHFEIRNGGEPVDPGGLLP